MIASTAAPPTAVAASATRLLQERIVSGAYAAGSLLPSQRDLAEQLGISRTSLREALSTLQGLGLVLVRPGKGVYVAEGGSPPEPAWRFATSHALNDVYQLRFALESLTARLACHAYAPDDLTVLRTNADAMRACIEAGDVAQAAQLDFDFHMHIIGIAGNRAIAEILRNSADVMQESQLLPFYKRGVRHTTYAEHMAIVDALDAGQPALAQQAMAQHIVHAAQRAGVHFPTGLDTAGG